MAWIMPLILLATGPPVARAQEKPARAELVAAAEAAPAVRASEASLAALPATVVTVFPATATRPASTINEISSNIIGVAIAISSVAEPLSRRPSR